MNYENLSKDDLIKIIKDKESSEREVEKKTKNLMLSEEKFRKIVEASSIGMNFWTLGEDGELRLDDSNPASNELLGFTVSDLRGQTFEKVFPGIENTDFPQMYKDIARGKIGPQAFETPYKDKKIDGYYYLNVYNIGGSSIVTTFTDWTIRKKAEDELMEYKDNLEAKIEERAKELKESEEKFRSIVEASSIGMVFYKLDDNDNLIVADSNPAANKLLGFEVNSFIGKNITEAFPSIGKSDFLQVYKNIAKGTVDAQSFETQYRDNRVDGYYNINAYRVGSSSMVVTFTDVTERKKIDEEKERLYKQIEKYNDDLKRLLYMTSHDFRSPLINITGFSNDMIQDVNNFLNEVLSANSISEVKEKVETLKNEEFINNINFINEGIMELDVYFRGLLKLSRVGGASISKEQVDVSSLVSDVLKPLKGDIDRLGAEIVIDKLPEINTDPTLLRTIFTNLISNSLKFTSPDRKSKINISAKEEGDKVYYILSDNGLGIEKKETEKVFDFFYTEGGRAKPTGEGLGLSLVKWAALKLEGEITLESEPGKGSTFILTLQKTN